MRHFLAGVFGILLAIQFNFGQAPKKSSTSEIYHSIEKLNFLGSAMYIAAHPDDENTRLISYLSNNVHARTAYLSLTRGDGGQNLIGPELRELLGVLRTEELLAARRVDGGIQYFTRANDFGYSKHPNETLKIWDKEAVLGDVVNRIRAFKPDIIINRFDHRSPGTTHGHHTSSAILSVEAFDLAGNPAAYTSQLSTVVPWQPKRLFFNTSWWFYGSEENFKKADKSKLLTLDTGVYYPMMGMSNNEIASLASSQHLCQGFGRLTSRGSENEYLELLKGDMPEKDPENLFEGIDTSWSRIEGGEAVGKILYQVEKEFNFTDPSQHLPELVKAYELLQQVKDDHWKRIKLQELEDLIESVAGLYLEASAASPYTNPGNTVNVSIEAINRSNASIFLKAVYIAHQAVDATNIPLENNQKKNLDLQLNVPMTSTFTSPYWLAEKGSLGMYKVADNSLIGKPETPPAFVAEFLLDINGTLITFKKPVVYRYSRPDKGELYSPFEILPPATSGIKDKVLIFADASPKEVPVTIKALRDNVQGTLELKLPEGWTANLERQPFLINKKDDEKTVSFWISPPDYESEGIISPIITVDGKTISKELVTIAYDHIPTQSVLLPSEAKVVRLNIQKSGQNIGYIMGAGDQVPESLEQIGYTVQMIDVAGIQEGSLDSYDAIVVGIRAYNVVDELKFKQRFLLEYVKNGGNLIIQYNTSGRSGLDFENLAPYELQVSRDRVTDEASEVTMVHPEHPLVNYPNKIRSKDFEGWVQERGLYFPDKWDNAFTPVFSMADSGEDPKEGSLLIASYGKGTYIYTGLSFFRELPAGVSGAFRLFANMLSQNNIPNKPTVPVKGK